MTEQRYLAGGQEFFYPHAGDPPAPENTSAAAYYRRHLHHGNVEQQLVLGLATAAQTQHDEGE